MMAGGAAARRVFPNSWLMRRSKGFPDRGGYCDGTNPAEGRERWEDRIGPMVDMARMRGKITPRPAAILQISRETGRLSQMVTAFQFQTWVTKFRVRSVSGKETAVRKMDDERREKMTPKELLMEKLRGIYGVSLLDDFFRMFPNLRMDSFPPGCLTIVSRLATPPPLPTAKRTA